MKNQNAKSPEQLTGLPFTYKVRPEQQKI